MAERRLLGIDLGITTAHTAAILDQAGQVLGRRRCRPTVASLEAVEAAALKGAPADTRLEVVVESTGPAWLPVAVFFAGRGHAVYLVPVAKAADLRRFLSRHAKSNAIDAETLARLPLVDPAGLQPLELPSGSRASLDRRVRTCQWLTEQATSHKVRIRELARQLFPTLNDAVDSELRGADLAVLERYGDPRALLDAGHERIAELLRAGSAGHLAAAKVQSRARAWVGVAQAAVELYGDDRAMPYADLAAELACQVRLLRAVLAEQKPNEQARERAYLRVEPDELARTLPGIAEVGAPLLVAAMGRPQRFASAAKFKAFTGLTPKASETGETDRKGQAITKAGAARLRKQLVCSANTARQVDPQLAAVYHAQMVERGTHHIKALCVVAAKLAERFWVVQTSGQPYVLRDVDGRQVSIAEARRIIATRYAVPEEVRRRRRSTKPRGGKAPQHVLNGHAPHGTSRAEPRRASPRRSSTAPWHGHPVKRLKWLDA
jgi:transposase